MRIEVNGQGVELAERTSVAQLLAEMAVRADYVAVEVNAELVPRSSRDSVQLAEGDRVEIVTLVGGG